MRLLSEVKCRRSGKILQKKVTEAVVTFGYDHRHECFLLQVQEELKEKKNSLTTKHFEHDLVEEGNHNATSWHHLRANCQEWYCPGLAEDRHRSCQTNAPKQVPA